MQINPVVWEWSELIVRWLHVTTSIVWIGTSFYFTTTDMKLRPGEDLPTGVKGDAWQIHGGNFWHMVKYTVAPQRLPSAFTVYHWDSRTTWLSGAALLILVYYLHADLFLIDKSVMNLTPLEAAGFSIITLVIGWLAYDGLCRSRLGEHDALLAIIVYVLLVLVTYAFTHVLSGRAAVNQIGALIGTFMVANAFFIIHPNQKKCVTALLNGQSPDPQLVTKARQRSIHNNYLTLPVILLMISNHYPLMYATRYNWVIVAIILALGPVIRHFFNERNSGHGSPWWTWGVAAAGMAAIGFLFTAGPRTTAVSEVPSAQQFSQVANIISSRCSMCHMDPPVWAGLNKPGKGILLDTPAEIKRHAELINETAVLSDAMPPGNVTGMTAAERKLVGSWASSLQ